MKIDTQTLITQYRELFKGRTDVFAVGKKMSTGKFIYPPERDSDENNIPLSDDYLFRHLKGDIIIGSYPLFDEEYVLWAALDFDGGEGTTEDPIIAAREQQTSFQRDGIISYIERSQSGKGAHLWIFLDKPIKARVIRNIVRERLLDSATFDRMFPNQDSSSGKYGNLIALPYYGAAYKSGNSAFIDDNDEKIPLGKFLASVTTNMTSFIATLESTVVASTSSKASKSGPAKTLSGSLKVTTFCKWMNAAKARMPNPGQEPEFYALCCQFAMLDDGERLAYEFGKLHPYSDNRIQQKFDQARAKNMPHTCRTLREEYGYECTCDIDYGVTHCYELANKSFSDLMSSKKGAALSFSELAPDLLARTKKIMDSSERFGLPLGFNYLDDLTALRNGNLIVIGARPSIGKAQPLHSKVLTPNGFVSMRDIKVGDAVIGHRGEHNTVLSIHPQGEEDVYEVTFIDRTKVLCSLNHLWLTSTHKERKNTTQGPTVKTLKDIKATLTEPNGDKMRWNHQIPINAPVQLESSGDITLDPYVMGALLGDGGLTASSVMFFNPDSYVVKKISNLLPPNDLMVDTGDNLTYRITKRTRIRESSETRTALKQLELDGASSHTKFIPKQYLFSSIDNRISLLRGLVDTDGYIYGTGVEYTTVSKQLALDIGFLVRSLGGICTTTTKIGTYKKNNKTILCSLVYRLFFSFKCGIIPASLPRKCKQLKNFTRTKNSGKSIVSVKKHSRERTQCISVSGRDGLYITDDFNVTHNTSFVVDISANLTNMNVPVYVASMEMNAEEYMIKYISRQIGIDSRAILEGTITQDEYEMMENYKKANPTIPLFIDDTTKDIDKLMDVFADAMAKHGPGPIMVDYIEMIRMKPGETMTQMTGRAALELKGLARALNVPVIVLSNFNRKAEQEMLETAEIMDSWLRNNGLLEQTADVILYILGKRSSKAVTKRRIYIQKERFTGKASEEVFMWFEQSLSKFHTKNPGVETGSISISPEFVNATGAYELL